MYKTVLNESKDASAKLIALVQELNDVFAAAYDTLFERDIATGEGDTLAQWTQLAQKIVKDTAGKVLQQPTSELRTLFVDGAYQVDSHFQKFFQRIAEEGGGRFVAARMKSSFRALEKTAFVQDAKKRWDASGICDIVRGAIECKSLAEIIKCVEALRNAVAEFEILRIKDRMSPGE